MHMSQLRAELAQVKAENARLAVVCRMAYEKLSWLNDHIGVRDGMHVALLELAKGADSDTFRDLLAPTLELLEECRCQAVVCAGHRIDKELARLRALTERK